MIGDAAHAFGESGDIRGVVRSNESRRRPRVETIRAAVRHRTIFRGLEGPVTGELLRRHPPVFSPSLKVYDDLIQDPFAPGQGPG